MISFRHPLAWIGLVALTVPIAIHLLVRAPARPIVLASLRFVPASPMRALRRRLLNDVGLLALRLALLALAVAAFADPFLFTGCRARAWNARLIRAVVADARADAATLERTRDIPAAFATARVSEDSLRQGLTSAMVMLDKAPPGRREIVVVGPLELGSLDEQALRDVPREVGVRFVRTRAATGATPVDGPRTSRRDREGLAVVQPRVLADGPRTVSTSTAREALPPTAIERTPHGWRAHPFDLDLASPDTARPALHAALVAALGVGAPIPERTGQPIMLLLDPTGDASAWTPPVEAPSQPWMSDAIGIMIDDTDLARESRGARATTDAPLPSPWLTLVRDSEDRVLVAAGATTKALVVRARVEPTSWLVPALIRGVLSSRLDQRRFARAETWPIPETQLAAWSRPPADVDAQTLRTHHSDRSWFWIAVIAGLVVEGVVRRRRPGLAQEDGSRDRAA